MLWSARMRYYSRHMGVRLSEALDSARVVVLHGARQSGKTTLARALASERGGTYLTLDNDQVLDAALADPHTLVRAYPYPLVIDEVQVAGERLVRALKVAVDSDPIRGRYVITGSTNFLTVPTISESLAGRAAILQLSPLSQAELAGIALNVGPGGVPGVIGDWFEGEFDGAGPSQTSRDDYLEKVCDGGYPEVIDLEPHARIRWFESYMDTVLGRDIVALGDIRRASLLSRLLRLAAASTATEINITKWAQRLGADRATVESYLGWLRTVFLVRYLPSWTRNRAARGDPASQTPPHRQRPGRSARRSRRRRPPAPHRHRHRHRPAPRDVRGKRDRPPGRSRHPAGNTPPLPGQCRARGGPSARTVGQCRRRHRGEGHGVSEGGRPSPYRRSARSPGYD